MSRLGTDGAISVISIRPRLIIVPIDLIIPLIFLLLLLFCCALIFKENNGHHTVILVKSHLNVSEGTNA